MTETAAAPTLTDRTEPAATCDDWATETKQQHGMWGARSLGDRDRQLKAATA